MTRTESRLAAYAGCLDGDEVLLARYVVPKGEPHWTLPGGKVEHGEDPFDTVIREFAEETGCHAVVERLLGTTSAFSTRFGFAGGELRPEPNGETEESAWFRVGDVAGLPRAVEVTGLLRH